MSATARFESDEEKTNVHHHAPPEGPSHGDDPDPAKLENGTVLTHTNTASTIQNEVCVPLRHLRETRRPLTRAPRKRSASS